MHDPFHPIETRRKYVCFIFVCLFIQNVSNCFNALLFIIVKKDADIQDLSLEIFSWMVSLDTPPESSFICDSGMIRKGSLLQPPNKKKGNDGKDVKILRSNDNEMKTNH